LGKQGFGRGFGNPWIRAHNLPVWENWPHKTWHLGLTKGVGIKKNGPLF